MNAARLAEIIKAKRQADNLSLREVAKITGISTSTLSRLERGIAPDLEVWFALREWLGVSLDDLLFGEVAELRTAQVLSTPAAVGVLLRFDKKLSGEAADALIHLFRVAYGQLAGERRVGG